MSKFKRAHERGVSGLPTYRLSVIEESRLNELTGMIDPMEVQRREIMVQQIINDNILSLEGESTVLARIGAYTFLFSQIENRLRAMYRQRYAVMVGAPAPKPADENDEPDEEVNKYKANESYDLFKIISRLKEYDDIDSETAKDLFQFTTIRNKMIHQAVYRLTAFKPDMFTHLIELYNHMVRVRNRMTSRVTKDRKVFFGDTQAAVGNLVSNISLHEHVTRDKLFELLGGSVTLSVPIVNLQPLYVIAKPNGTGGLIQLSLGSEYESHNLWKKVLVPDKKYLIFRKVPFLAVPTVEKLGYGNVIKGAGDGEYIINIVDGD